MNRPATGGIAGRGGDGEVAAIGPIAFTSIVADTSFMTAMYVTERPDETEVSMASEVLPHVREYLANHHDDVVRLEVTDDHETLNLPRSAVELLARVLAHMAAGQGVSIVPSHAELTTQQARRPTS